MMTADSQLTLTLRPDAENCQAVDVFLVLDGINAQREVPLLEIATQLAGVKTVPYRAEDIDVTDDLGVLPLQQSTPDGAVKGGIPFTYFLPLRDSQGVVNIRYRAPLPAAGSPRRSAPPFDLRTDAGGISGAGMSFMLLPTTEQELDMTLRWDLSNMSPHARGVSSLGVGDISRRGKTDLLKYGFYMAGALNSIPAEPGEDSPFSAWWQGTPNFNCHATLPWIEKCYYAILDFFAPRQAHPFNMFIRPGSIDNSGGAALLNSFMISYGQQPEPENGLKFLMAHEMVHPIALTLDQSGVTHSWYSEGCAEYFKLIITLAYGLIDNDAFLGELRDITQGYYANPQINVPQNQLDKDFWSNSLIRRLPYDRGLLYLATVNARLQDVSNGKIGIDAIIRELLHAKADGAPLDQRVWLARLSEEMGSVAQQDFDAMMAGNVLIPPAHAFGQMFDRREITLRQFELGFEEISLQEGRIRGLKPDSNAALAGLEEGDEVVSFDNVNHVVPLTDAEFNITIRRNNQTLALTYLPRGKRVTGYQWVVKEN